MKNKNKIKFTVKGFHDQYKVANKGGIVTDVSKFFDTDGKFVADVDSVRIKAVTNQKRKFMGARAFYMTDDVKMTDIIEVKGARGAVRVIQSQGIKASKFDIETFIPVAIDAIRAVGSRQATIWADAGVNIYDIAAMGDYIRQIVETIITTAGRSESGNTITPKEIDRDMIRGFFATYISRYTRATLAKESDRKAFDKGVRAAKDIISYSYYILERNGVTSHINDNGFKAYESKDIGKDSIKSFTDVIYYQFIEYSDILIIKEVKAEKKSFTHISINPDVMASIIVKVTESKMSHVSGGYFLDESIPEVNLNMSMGHSTDIIGKEVSVYGSTHHEDLGDTSVVVEAINNNNKSGLVIDQFMASNFDDIQAALKAAKAKL